jgi:hypothetical protein
VVRAAGAEFEADLSFAALNQVLYPLLGGLQQLSALHGNALRVALGLRDGSPADRLVVSNAALCHRPGRRSWAARLTCAAISGISSISTSRSALARTSSRIGDVAVTVARRA